MHLGPSRDHGTFLSVPAGVVHPAVGSTLRKSDLLVLTEDVEEVEPHQGHDDEPDEHGAELALCEVGRPGQAQAHEQVEGVLLEGGGGRREGRGLDRGGRRHRVRAHGEPHRLSLRIGYLSGSLVDAATEVCSALPFTFLA